MGYGYYEIDGIERGYNVPDVCNHPGCDEKIDRGLSYLCYGCTKYFCGKHLSVAYCKHDKPVPFDCFAGQESTACLRCCKQEGIEWDCNCPADDEVVNRPEDVERAGGEE